MKSENVGKRIKAALERKVNRKIDRKATRADVRIRSRLAIDPDDVLQRVHDQVEGRAREDHKKRNKPDQE